jgi:hypothetical protein
MIKLKKLLNEIDFGKIPLADPGPFSFYGNDKKFAKFLAKYNYGEERNTKEEDQFIYSLLSYVADPNVSSTIASNIASVMKELLPLKSKFPGILDPSSSSKYVYRGTTIPINTFINSPSKFKGDDLIFDVNINITSKGNKSFLSFSKSKKIAEIFAEQQVWTKGAKLVADGLLPVIIAMDSSNPNLIFNPKVISFFNDFGANEQETFYVGNTITTDKIILPKEAIHKLIQEQLINVPKNIPEKYQADYNKLKSIYNK